MFTLPITISFKAASSEPFPYNSVAVIRGHFTSVARIWNTFYQDYVSLFNFGPDPFKYYCRIKNAKGDVKFVTANMWLLRNGYLLMDEVSVEFLPLEEPSIKKGDV